MPREIDSLIDDIDRLVDDQIAAGPVGDYNVNRYDKCWHCGRDWHGIPITERIANMRVFGRYDDDYRLAEDDSRLLCPGSDFIGPVQPSLSERETAREYLLHRHNTRVDALIEALNAESHRRLERMLSIHVVASAERMWNSINEAWNETFDAARPGFTHVGSISEGWRWVADSDQPSTEPAPAPAPVISPVNDQAISSRRRARQQLRARTQQQARAATTRQQLADRMRSRMQEIGTA